MPYVKSNAYLLASLNGFNYEEHIPASHIMTEELFKTDSYVSEFEAEITKIEGDRIVLGGTAFYPGGGGQVCDTGTMGGFRVTETSYDGDEIVHTVPGHGFKVGDRIWCSVDWNRRYDLMKGHTAEHLLFNALHRQDPEMGIVKIYISPESKYVVVDRDISWEDIRDAVRFANGVIAENHTVIRSVINRNDPEMSRIRAKLDRIAEEEIDVVEIEDVDLAACCGIHVMETGEIGALFVDRKVSTGKEGMEIHFVLGEKAIERSMDLAFSCLSIVDDLGSKPGDVVRTVSNLKKELKSTRRQLKESVVSSLRSVTPYVVNGTDVYEGVFPTSDRSILVESAESCKNRGGVAAFIGEGDGLIVVLASGNDRIDCRNIVNDVLGRFEGRGGGKKDFAQGGIPDIGSCEKVADAFRIAIRESLEEKCDRKTINTH